MGGREHHYQDWPRHCRENEATRQKETAKQQTTIEYSYFVTFFADTHMLAEKLKKNIKVSTKIFLIQVRFGKVMLLTNESMKCKGKYQTKS